MTPDLTGPERLAVFLQMPGELMAEAWSGMRERTEAVRSLEEPSC